jgi:hypothetical protein
MPQKISSNRVQLASSFFCVPPKQEINNNNTVPVPCRIRIHNMWRQAILGMATFSSCGATSNQRLCNIQPVRKLLHWLTVTEYENHEQQEWFVLQLPISYVLYY